MFHVRAPKRLIVGMLALVFGLMVVQSAAAATAVIPYLSHGIGVDQSLYSGQSHQLRRTSSTRRIDPGPDAFMRAVARHEASLAKSANLNTYNYERVVAQAEAVQPQVVRPDDRAGTRGIETRTYSPSTSTDLNTSNYERVVANAEAVQSHASRPDDRAGSLGIGSGGAASQQSSVSSSSTDWNTILLAVGAVLAAMLLAGWGIQFGRRQSGRVVTH
jgi:hypothetical protein